MTGTQLANVLLVEDNLGDARLTMEALKDSKLCIDITHVEDGAAAMDYLNKSVDERAYPLPDLILLDLNLPKKNGMEVLSEVKSRELLSRIPVVILTTSEAEEDIVKSYDLQANCYVTKPVDFGGFVEVVNSIDDFWFGLVKLPPKQV